MIQAALIHDELAGTPAALLGAIPDSMSLGSVLSDTIPADGGT